MRRIILQIMTSLDGFFEGPDRELDWHRVDAEFNEYAAGLLNNVDLLLFGRVTYQLMEGYWPAPAANDPVIAGEMNSLPKIIFSKTLKSAGWMNTRLVKENITEEVSKLKEQPGRDIAIFGSSDLALTFIPLGLIDEYRIIVNPVVLGGGKTLFKGTRDRLDLKLIKTKIFRSGNVLFYYEPVKEKKIA